MISLYQPRFKNSVWEEYASTKEKRGCAAAVMHNDRLHVFGGYSGSSSLQTTETINVDGEVSYGPDLPTAVRVHAMTKINGTVSLLSGGSTDTDSYSAKTWYYNHDTETFTSGGAAEGTPLVTDDRASVTSDDGLY